MVTITMCPRHAHSKNTIDYGIQKGTEGNIDKDCVQKANLSELKSVAVYLSNIFRFLECMMYKMWIVLDLKISSHSLKRISSKE